MPLCIKVLCCPDAGSSGSHGKARNTFKRILRRREGLGEKSNRNSSNWRHQGPEGKTGDIEVALAEDL